MVEYMKENVVRTSPPGLWTLVGAVGLTVAMLLLAVFADRSLPMPLTRDAPKDQFIAEIAYEHLLNLTSIGPRVAGTYENEVLGVRVVMDALRGIAAAAAAHNVIDIDLQRASGNFTLTFFDGLNNVYQDVQNVVARVRARGGRADRKPALLLNCHIDTVPDSPGASDDAAGCAVALEALRALAAAPRPLPHPVLLLANGAEENIMQGSHAFVTQHRWARDVRTFINMEACGAGGREVLFQAGPRDPWLMEEYARSVPYPFASSLAQEMFESGLIPADTDFRIFRDFGNLSGVDLAWSSNGYVYHTGLDDATRVPRASLQRTGDNVLALATGLLWGGQLDTAVEERSRQPVFFDVAGLALVTAGARGAALAAALALALAALRLLAGVRRARRTLGMSARRYLIVVLSSGAEVLTAGATGVAAATLVALAVRALGAPLAWYARPWLLGPLYLAPALAAAAYTLPSHSERRRWQPYAAADAVCLVWAAALAVGVALGLRASFLPLHWVLLPAAADLAACAARATDRSVWWWWGAGAALPLVQWWGAALGALGTLLPLAGRAGRPPLAPDAAVGALLAAVALAACSWLAPLLLVLSRRRLLPPIYVCAAMCACACAYAAWGGAAGAYSAARPQRVMALRVRRAEHAPLRPNANPLTEEHFYWLPELDDNTAGTVRAMGLKYPLWSGGVPAHSAAACARWPYCGAPYFLPVAALVPAALRLPAHPPAGSGDWDFVGREDALRVEVARLRVAPRQYRLQFNISGPSHVVAVVSPVRGGRVEGGLAARPWKQRNTYFYTLFAGRRANSTRSLDLLIHLPDRATSGLDDDDWERAEIASVMVAGHWMGEKRSAAHDAFLRPLVNAAATGHAADVRLYRV